MSKNARVFVQNAWTIAHQNDGKCAFLTTMRKNKSKNAQVFTKMHGL